MASDDGRRAIWRSIRRRPLPWVVGGAILFGVIVLWARSRAGAPAAVEPLPEPVGGPQAGGFFAAGPSPQERIGLEQANLALEEQRKQALQRERLGELEVRERETRLSAIESGVRLERQYGEALLPSAIQRGQAEHAAAREAAAAAGSRARQERQLGEALLPSVIQRRKSEEAAARQAAETARVSEAKLTERAAKAPVKCPPGQHPANVPGVGFVCRTLGDPGGGRGFRPFKQAGEIAGGVLRGVGQAAPAIGAGAAEYAAGRAGLGLWRRPQASVEPAGRQTSAPARQPIRFGTPGINPNVPPQGPSYSPFSIRYPWEARK